jgi:hypothetical protein
VFTRDQIRAVLLQPRLRLWRQQPVERRPDGGTSVPARQLAQAAEFLRLVAIGCVLGVRRCKA